MDKNIKVGDVVVFFMTGTTGRKKGQVVDIIESDDGNICMVFVDSDNYVYEVQEDRVKKV